MSIFLLSQYGKKRFLTNSIATLGENSRLERERDPFLYLLTVIRSSMNVATKLRNVMHI